LVDSSVVLADDVLVGPGCVLRGDIRIGCGCVLEANVHLRGPLTMGEGNRLYPFVCLGFPPQDLKYDPDMPGAGTVIGDRNIFREGCTVHRATKDQPTRIGSDNYLMTNSHVGHDCVVGNRCTLVSGSLLGGHAEVADGVILGGGSAVHQFCRIGRLAMISGAVAVSQDLPPFCVAHYLRRVGSLNLVGLRRAGLREHIKPLQRAFDLFFRQRHTNIESLATIEQEVGDDPLVREFVTFIRASKRGITAYATQDNAGE
jgi:UDP-N-acetylglucosamine acyltransferase